ncbi:hypothetical protein PoB_000363200 [Plakobranchus ocellatus]|uniref:Uncharacterized protein n=1 Tax=Plakobranchus ocellatus TaxID=259542 RepID=A0AAV3Y3V1_9GAST|nr:hypothetical protein PoB_000363200 [Plakobranchus ocellatus]
MYKGSMNNLIGCLYLPNRQDVQGHNGSVTPGRTADLFSKRYVYIPPRGYKILDVLASALMLSGQLAESIEEGNGRA